MHTCIFLCSIQRIDPHGDALSRNVLALLYLVLYVRWNDPAPSCSLIHHVVMFLAVHLKADTWRQNYESCALGLLQTLDRQASGLSSLTLI